MSVGLLMLSAGPLGAGDRLSMLVSPAVAFEPANLTVRAMVEVDKDNRSMEIRAESDDFYRSSEIQLNGDRVPRTTLFEFKSLPSGDYQVRVVLKGTQGRELALVQQAVSVIGSASGIQ